MNSILVPKTFDCFLLESDDTYNQVYARTLADLTRSDGWRTVAARSNTRDVARKINSTRVVNPANAAEPVCMVIITNNSGYASAVEMPRSLFEALVLKCIESLLDLNVPLPFCLRKLLFMRDLRDAPPSVVAKMYFSQLFDFERARRFARRLETNTKDEKPDVNRDQEAEHYKRAMLAALSDRPTVAQRKKDEERTKVSRRYIFDMDAKRLDRMRRRFCVAMQTAYVLLVHRYGGLQDLWSSNDHFYLYQLSMSNRSADEKHRQIETLLAKKLAFKSNGDNSTADDVHRLLDAVRDDVLAAGLVNTICDDYNFRQVLSEFQIATNDNQHIADRIADPTDNVDVVHYTMSSFESLVQFATDYCLLDVLDARRARWSANGVVVRFDSLVASPLRVLTTIRTFVPHADVNTDYALFWTPASNEFYLRTTDQVWHRLIMGGLTFASAQLRARSKSGVRMLCTPLIYAALASEDAAVVSSGVTATLMLMTAGFRYQNLLRSPEHAKELVRNLDAVLHAFCGTPCDNVKLARLILEPVISTRSDGARVVRPMPDGLYAAVFAALAGDDATLQIDVRKLKTMPMDDSRFCNFIKAQINVCVDMATFRARLALATKNQSVALATKNVAGLKCGCGLPLDCCLTASSVLQQYVCTLPKVFSGILCCVCCERAGLSERGARPGAPSGSRCSNCLACGLVVGAPSDSLMVALTDASATGLFNRHEIVQEFARQGATDLLSNLRLVTDGETYRPPTPRSLQTRASMFAPSKHKTLGRNVSLDLTTTFLADIAAVEPDARIARLLFVLALESIALTSLADLVHFTKPDVVAAILAPMPVEDIARTLNVEEVEQKALRCGQFPLCRSAVLENARYNEQTMKTTAGDAATPLFDRAAQLLFDMKSVAPLTGAPPLLATLLFDETGISE